MYTYILDLIPTSLRLPSPPVGGNPLSELTFASDGFMCNLAAVMLTLSEPFLVDHSRIMKVSSAGTLVNMIVRS